MRFLWRPIYLRWRTWRRLLPIALRSIWGPVNAVVGRTGVRHRRFRRLACRGVSHTINKKIIFIRCAIIV